MSIKTTNLKVGYDKHVIVDDFNQEFLNGKITSIIGANGCGKSTVLKAIGRIIPSMSGYVELNGMLTSELKTKDIAKLLAILPQSPTAPGTISVFDLVSYGRFPYQKGFGRLNDNDKAIIEWALKATNMYDFKDREIANLSGGQRQRVWISMCLAQQSEIIMLDEPTTYLDLCHQLEILELLKKLNETQGVTIIMVLHDLNLASKYSDYLVAMKNGSIYNYGTPENVYTRKMLNDVFEIDGEISLINGKPQCVSYELLNNNIESKWDNHEENN